MPRESSGGYTKMPPIQRKPEMAAPVETAEVRQLAKPVEGTFVPNDAQRMARARVLVATRNDPLLNLSKLTSEQLAKLTRMPTQARNWLQTEGFREWLTASTDLEERTEYVLSLWLDEMIARVQLLSDKDLIGAGKLLVEVSHKQASKSQAQQPALDSMSTEQLKKLVGDALGNGSSQD